MATDPVRIELEGLATEREEAQRDLERTLGALEDRLMPVQAARRLVVEHNPMIVVAAFVAGAAFGFARHDGAAGRTASLVAAAAAGALLSRLGR
jgi:hypothetical protein